MSDNDIEFAKRITNLRVKKGWTRTRLAQEIGLRPQSVDDWEKGRTFPKGKRLQKLAKLLDTDVVYLLTGKTTSGEQDDTILQLFHISINNEDITVHVPHIKEVEYRDDSGKSHFEITESLDKKPITLCKRNLDNKKIKIENIVCITLKGNSMLPYLPDSTLVAIDTGDTVITDGSIYAVIIQKELLRIRLIHRLPNNEIHVRSFDNKNYPDEKYNLDDVMILGRMFWSAIFW